MGYKSAVWGRSSRLMAQLRAGANQYGYIPFFVCYIAALKKYNICRHEQSGI
jgi:hypothetical protein